MKRNDKRIQAIVDYYNEFDEKDRLSNNWGQIEYTRSCEIIEHYLGGPPAIILDIGGAAGKYACWLAGKGYDVHVIDPVQRHIEQAKENSDKQPDYPVASFSVGDARRLHFNDAYADIVLLMGPLYHLLTAEDRIQALKESYRVLKQGGLVFAVGISRFASCIDGLMSGHFKEAQIRNVMMQDLKNGQHRNPTDNKLHFMDTFFHLPDELGAEIIESGFSHIATHAVEGIGYMMKDFDENWNCTEYREFLLAMLRKMDKEASIIGASPHIMCVGRKH